MPRSVPSTKSYPLLSAYPHCRDSRGGERVLRRQTKGKRSLLVPSAPLSCRIPNLERCSKSKGSEKGKHPETPHAHDLQMTVIHPAWCFWAFTAEAPQTGNFCEDIILGSALCVLQSISSD